MKTVLALAAASALATALLLASQPDPITTGGVTAGGRPGATKLPPELTKPGAPLDRY